MGLLLAQDDCEFDEVTAFLDAIGIDSYRVEKQAVQKIVLSDADGEINSVPTRGGGHVPEAELGRLSNILKTFNGLFGDIAWEDTDRVRQLIIETIPSRVAVGIVFRNARQNRLYFLIDMSSFLLHEILSHFHWYKYPRPGQVAR